MQVWVPLGQFLLLFLTMTPPPGIVSVHQTELFVTPQPHLCSSFCLEWSFSTLPGAGPFSSIKSQLMCPLPNQTWKVESPVTLHLSLLIPCGCNHKLFLLLAYVRLSPHWEPYRTGTLSHLVHSISSFHHRAWCAQQTSHARCYLTRPLGPEAELLPDIPRKPKAQQKHGQSCSSGPTQFPAIQPTIRI